MKPILIKCGGYQKPASIHNRSAAAFGKTLKDRMGDAVGFELIGDVLALGRQSGDLPLMVQNSELSLCYISTVRFTKAVPELQLLELPFMFSDRALLHRAFAGEFGKLLKRRMLEKTPFRLLGIWDNGFRHLTNKVRPIRTPADCKDLKIRTQISNIHVEALGAVGFKPLPVDVKEFVDKIAGDTFDAQDNPLTNTYNFGVHNYHRYITLSSHFFGATGFICNEMHYQSWPREVQAAVDAAAEAATALQWQLAGAEDAEMLKKLETTDTEIIRLTSAEHSQFVRAAEPVLAKYRKQFDPKLFEMLNGREQQPEIRS